MIRLFKKQSDQEILLLIQDGNKNILLKLYKSHFSVVRKFIESCGGNKNDAADLLQEALTQFWSEANSKEFVLSQTIQDVLLNKVRTNWRSKHDATAIRSFMTSRLSGKGAALKKGILVIGATLLLVVAAWWYFDSLPVNNLEEHMPFISNTTVDSSAQKSSNAKANGRRKENTSIAENGINSDQTSLDSTNTANNSGDSIEATNPLSDDFVIRKDELLFARIIQVIDKKTDKNSDRSLAQETASRLNPEAGLPEESDKANTSFAVEFWKSPVNYKGYKAGKNKLVFYGIDEPDWVHLLQLDGKIYLEYVQNYYLLEQYMDFQSFAPVNDPALTSQLKR